MSRLKYERSLIVFFVSIVLLVSAIAFLIDRAVSIGFSPLALYALSIVWLALSAFDVRGKSLEDAESYTSAAIVMFVTGVFLIYTGFVEMGLFPITLTIGLSFAYPSKVLRNMEF